MLALRLVNIDDNGMKEMALLPLGDPITFHTLTGLTITIEQTKPTTTKTETGEHHANH